MTSYRPGYVHTTDSGLCFPQQWPASAGIQVRDLTVSQDDEDVLKHVSFNVLPGEKVALVGRAGAEKHALLASIFQFMETRGSIKIDGVNIAWVSLVFPFFEREMTG